MWGDSVTANKLPNEMFVEADFDLDTITNEGKSLNEIFEEVEIKLIKNALIKTNNNRAKAKELLGLPPSTLKSKIEKFGIL